MSEVAVQPVATVREVVVTEISLAHEPSRAVTVLVRTADIVAVAGAYLAMVCLVGMTLLMLAQIAVSTLSKFLPFVTGDIPIAWEYSSYLMGATFMLGSGMTLRAGRHIRLGIVIGNTRPRTRRVLEAFSSLVALGFTVFLTYALGRAAIQQLSVGSTSVGSGTPTWVPMAVFALGSLILTMQFLARVVACIAGLPTDNVAFQVATGVVE